MKKLAIVLSLISLSIYLSYSLLAVPEDGNIKMHPVNLNVMEKDKDNTSIVTWKSNVPQQDNGVWLSQSNGSSLSVSPSVDVSGFDGATGNYKIKFTEPGEYSVTVKIKYHNSHLDKDETVSKTFNITWGKVIQFNVLPEKQTVCKNSDLTESDFVIVKEPSSFPFVWSRESTAEVGQRKSWLKYEGKNIEETEFKVVDGELVEEELIPNPLNDGPRNGVITTTDLIGIGNEIQFYYENVVSSSTSTFILVKDFGLSQCGGTINITTSTGHSITKSYSQLFSAVVTLGISYTFSKEVAISVNSPSAEPNKKIGLRTYDQKLTITTTGSIIKQRTKSGIGQPYSQWFKVDPSEARTEISYAFGPPQQQAYWACCR